MPVILALWEAKAGRSLELKVQDQPGQHGETHLSKKCKNWLVWWHTPEILATWVTEAEESLEPRRRRLQ